jgi:uncharacterized membrane protein
MTRRRGYHVNPYQTALEKSLKRLQTQRALSLLICGLMAVFGTIMVLFMINAFRHRETWLHFPLLSLILYVLAFYYYRTAQRCARERASLHWLWRAEKDREGG